MTSKRQKIGKGKKDKASPMDTSAAFSSSSSDVGNQMTVYYHVSSEAYTLPVELPLGSTVEALLRKVVEGNPDVATSIRKLVAVSFPVDKTWDVEDMLLANETYEIIPIPDTAEQRRHMFLNKLLSHVKERAGLKNFSLLAELFEYVKENTAVGTDYPLKSFGEILGNLMIVVEAAEKKRNMSAAKRIRVEGNIMQNLVWSPYTPITQVSIVPTLGTVGRVMDVSHLHVSGLTDEGLNEKDRCLLYIRPEYVKLWEQLNVERDKYYRRHLIVQGSPGTGKSSLVWAWCLWWAAVNPDKRLRWIHIMGKGGPVRFVDFQNGSFRIAEISQKMLDEFSSEDDESLYRDPAYSHVILDGVYRGIDLRPVHTAVYSPGGGRIVLVTSWQIPMNEEDGKRYRDYQLIPWSLQDYKHACKDEKFYQSVVRNLDAIEEDNASDGKVITSSDAEASEKERRINAKFYYAGKSVRWMFDCKTAQVIRDALHDFAVLAYGTSDGGVSRARVIDRLFFDVDFFGLDATPVSNFVAMWSVLNWKEDWVKSAYKIRAVLDRPAFHGWKAEFKFMRALRWAAIRNENEKSKEKPERQQHCLRLLPKMSPDSEKWPVDKVISFTDLEEILPQDLSANAWLIPTKYSEHCYNALQLMDLQKISETDATSAGELPTGKLLSTFPALSATLRVVQLAKAKSHALKLQYVATAIKTLARKGCVITALDVVIVVPKGDLAQYVLEKRVDIDGTKRVLELWDPKALRVVGFDRT